MSELSDMIEYYRGLPTPHIDRRDERHTSCFDTQASRLLRSRKKYERLDSVASLAYGTRHYGIPTDYAGRQQPPAGALQLQLINPSRRASSSSPQGPLFCDREGSQELGLRKPTIATVQSKPRTPSRDSSESSTRWAIHHATESNRDLTLPRTPLTKKTLEANSRSRSTESFNIIDRIPDYPGEAQLLPAIIDCEQQLWTKTIENEERLKQAHKDQRIYHGTPKFTAPFPEHSFQSAARQGSHRKANHRHSSYATFSTPIDVIEHASQPGCSPQTTERNCLPRKYLVSPRAKPVAADKSESNGVHRTALELNGPLRRSLGQSSTGKGPGAVQGQALRSVASLEGIALNEAAAAREFACIVASIVEDRERPFVAYRHFKSASL